jgi:hypothetical protein
MRTASIIRAIHLDYMEMYSGNRYLRNYVIFTTFYVLFTYVSVRGNKSCKYSYKIDLFIHYTVYKCLSATIEDGRNGGNKDFVLQMHKPIMNSRNIVLPLR